MDIIGGVLSAVGHANLRGIGTDFIGDANGSDKRYSFGISAEAQSDTLNLFESAVDLLSYYRSKAEAAEKNAAISSDDPEAVKKLKDKLQKLEDFQNRMKRLMPIIEKTAQ